MINTNSKLLFIFTLLSIGTIFGRSLSIGYCTDSNGNIQRNGNVRNGSIRKGDLIYHGDKIITGHNGTVAFMNIHNRSIVNLYENSVVRVFENKNQDEKYSEIALFGGKVIVEMEKEENGSNLILASPTAIATGSGTHFMAEYKDEILYENISYCVFTVLKGLLSVENVKSSHLIVLDEGDTIISTRSGKFLQLDTFRDKSGIVNTITKTN